MTVDRSSLGSFGDLAVALGLLDPTSGEPNPDWLSDPVSGGSGGDAHGLKHLLEDDDQRTALLHFVDEVMGPPDAPVREGATWVPLFSNVDPTITVYCVVEQVGDEVRVGVGLDHTTRGGPPTFTSRVHVPLFRFARRGSALTGGGPAPDWLLLGRAGGDVTFAIDATLSDTTPEPGDPSLGGASLSVTVPTATADVGFELTLRELQLPGAAHPETFTLDVDHADQIAPSVLNLLSSLVRAEADALGTSLESEFRAFAALAGMLGLRDVEHLSPLPIADLPVRGVRALVEWVEDVLGHGDARVAWLGQLANLVGGAVDATRQAVVIPVGNATGVGRIAVALGVRVTAGTGGHPVLVPWVEVSLVSRTAVVARAAVDLLRVDTGDGSVLAVPDARIEAVFGDAAHPLVATSPTLAVDSVRVGVALDALRRPAFVLTATHVTVDGATRDLVDLSSPDAALAAGADLVTGALVSALHDLGDPGDLVARLLGVTGTGGVSAISVPALVADPVGTIRDHWRAVLADTHGAMNDLLGRLSALVRGTVAGLAPGAGLPADPWLVSVAAADGVDVRLEAWREGDVLQLEAAAVVDRPVLTDLTLTSRLSVGVATLDLDLAAPHATFATGATLSAALARADDEPARLSLGPLSLSASELAVEATWRPATGARVRLRSDDLALEVDGADPVHLPLPVIGPTGSLTLPAPDWDEIEAALAALVGSLGLPELRAALALVGWSGIGPRLSLGDLLSGDPAVVTAALEDWLADLLLDCDVVKDALGPVAALLSGFSLSAPLGSGTAADPFRCPVAGVRRAPGLRAWLDPGCPARPDPLLLDTGALLTSTPPDPQTVVSVLRRAGEALPDLADLLVGRDSAGQGITELLTRLQDTDGLTGRPETMPDDVNAVILPGWSYDELVAACRTGVLAGRVLRSGAVGDVVHVGTEADLLRGRTDDTTVDLSGDDPIATLPAGAGPWFVRLPSPAAAAAARPDRGAVGEQAARLEAMLGGRAGQAVLVGYGAAGAAAVRAAGSLPGVTDVVTVGAPWSEPATLAFDAGLSGDALQLLRRLQRPDVPAWPDQLLGTQCTPLQRMRLLVRRAVDPAGRDLPRADVVARRTDLRVHAVFGALDELDLHRSLGAYAADAISARTPAADPPEEEQHALHLGIDVPVLDLDLGGLLVGAGAVFEACEVTREDGAPSVSLVRSLTVELHLGVHDGWLVGGPGSGSGTGDVRWVGVKVVVPFDGTPGSSELVLHEARGLGIDKEAWVVRAGADTVTETGAVPEVRVLVGDVLGRLRTASPSLATLLSRLALLDGAGGLDLSGFDRFLHDPAPTLRGLVAAAPAEIGAALRDLVPGATGSGSVVGWTVGDATLGVDLATGRLTAGLHTSVEGRLPVTVDVVAEPTTAYATVAVGEIDEHLGGARLVLATPRGGTGAFVRAEWAGAGGVPATVPLWPTLDTAGLTALVTRTLPAIALEGVVGALRATLSGVPLEALEAGLTACGLLRPQTYGGAAVRLPIGFVSDPAAYVVAVARQGGGDLAAAGVELLDALAHLVTDTAPSGTWPVTDGVGLRYAKVGDTLEVGLHVELDETLDGVRVRSGLDAGVVLRPGAAPAPAVGLSVLVGELGLALHLDPGLRLELLRAAPLAPLPLYPNGPGLGQAFATAAQTLVPELLDRVAALSGSSTGLARDVGTLVGEVGDALELREGGQFTATRITTFANDPAGALLGHLGALVGTAAAAVANALNGSPARVTVTQTAGTVTFAFGTAPDTVTVTLDATGPSPAVEVGGSWELPDVGVVRVEALRLSAVGVAVAATLGPFPVQAGPVRLRPLLTVAAGSGSATRLLGLGLALDDVAEQSVELRWGLDATAPVLVAVDRGSSPQVTEAGAPMRLLSLGVGLASGVLLEALPDGFLDARAIRMLRGVVFAEDATAPEIDPGVVLDLLRPEALLHRAERLLWNAATDTRPLSVTIDETVTIALTAVADGPAKQLGVSLSLPAGKRLKLADGDTVVELEVDAGWITPTKPPGLTILALRGTRSGDELAFELDPGVVVGGVGLRFTQASGPLLSLGAIALDGVAVRVYAECDSSGVGGGAQVAMLGLAVAPSGAGGNNSVANGIMADAGHASPAQRPAFSPSLAIQQPPHGDLGVSIRAGEPPGPWWVLVQRQLGPLYIERVGFDEKETDGRVSRVALLFDGGVSLFGLSAQVDQLSITWLGGDLLDIHQWAVDLMGLAISADMSGVTLAGGLLKTVDETGNPAYVGMLLGRFGIYGLTVFGGYTSLGGAPSFFVFGAFNGPIGGPPAFFLTGIGGGLGINRRLIAPTDPSQMDEFPFIQALDPYAQVPEPMAQLKKLAEIFPPELDNFWFAAGISFTCFSLVDGVAVVAVSFGQGLEIDLLGLARLALPNPAAALVSIELGLLARFSTTEGVFLIQAALTDNSWLLYEDVRLTGGFAFATWWKGPLSGQFVLTIGGYHPDFHVEGYPVVPRLGLSWQVTKDISIKGGSYFALTSEALMAGVGVEAVADFGWAWARASFGADGLVYFDPFWYDVSVRATISAGVDIDTWLGTISFSVTTGCGVHVWGPDFSGEATVEVGPCSVTIPFGSDARREGRRLVWSEFTGKYLEDAGGGAARALSGITGRGSLPSATDGGRSAPPPDGTADHPFEVYAEFEITLVTTVPSSHVDLEATVVPVNVVRSDGAPAALGLNPMKANVSGSVLRIRLEQFDDDTSTWDPDPADLAQLGHAVGTGSFPMGVWGPPSPGGSTSTPDRLPAGDVIVAGSQVTLTAAATGQPVGPELDYYKVEAGPRRPLPFTARQAQRVSLRKLAAKVTLPPEAEVGAVVAAARDILFAARPAPEAASPLLAAGVRSQVGRAGFRGGLAGPPLFGNLTDGLAVANADGVTSEPQSDPPPKDPPPVMDPRVVGFFAAGAAVAFRDARTTVVKRVATGPAKRRPAPTTASVHARLGAHLPISLQVSASPAVGVERTVAPPRMPFSGVASSARSYRLGDPQALGSVAGIGGFGGTALPAPKARASVRAAKAAGAPPTLASGGVVVLHAPDHATDTSELRPTLDLGGTGRVTCVRGDGRVLVDEVRSGPVDVPAGTALLAVQADAETSDLDGCAGWHARSRVAVLGPSAALAAGAVLVVEAGQTPAEPGWSSAGDLVRGAARVVTRFSSPARTVALIVEADLPDRVGDMGLLLEGATRAVGSDGGSLDPHLVMNGSQAVAIYDVVVDPAADAVQVSVAPGGDWRLTGVLGSDLPADQLAALVLRRGLVAATARLTATSGAGCSPVWGAAPRRPKRVAKKAVTKKAATKKTARRRPQEVGEEDGRQEDGREEDGRQEDGREEDGRQEDGRQEDGRQEDGHEEDGHEEGRPPGRRPRRRRGRAGGPAVVGDGKFQLYPRYDPPLKAGLYRFTSEQRITASGVGHTMAAEDTPNVEQLQTHVRVRSPQYALPPDQVLSTFPPANHEGDFGARLPQVVIKRRTLPWERTVDDDPAHESLPWLALVLIAEGEAEVRLNKPVAECVTPGVHLDPPADVELGNHLAIRASVVRRLFPTQDEIGLLAHVRRVDIHDTELMMGDDDGYLAVVISNRLPLPGKDAQGNPVPVKYLACLVNLCGQLDALLETEPVEVLTSHVPLVLETQAITLVEADKLQMRIGSATTATGLLHPKSGAPEPEPKAAPTGATRVSDVHLTTGTAAPFVGASSWTSAQHAEQDVYQAMASSFAFAETSGFISDVGGIVFDQELRFPVLLHWSFTTDGNDTFQSLVQGLSSGLLGTTEEEATPPGRPPFEVTETGHVGLDHRLRVGDQVRSWYRGPFVPHPTEDPPEGRLAIAHASDQLRIVVPDGREDLSLAAAFEIGRLLGLSRPSIVASLLRWRQAGFAGAWLSSSYAGRGYLDLVEQLDLRVDRLLGGHLGALVARAIVTGPSEVLGNPAPLVTAGRAVTDLSEVEVMAAGLGIDARVLAGTPATVLGRLGQTRVPLPDLDLERPPKDVRDGLSTVLDDAFTRAAVQALAPDLRDGTVTIDADQLPSDLRAHLSSALAPDTGALRDRLGLRVRGAALPKHADQLDVLMHAAPVDPDETDGTDGTDDGTGENA